MVRVESLGSIWLIDEGAGRYCRFPKSEAPRERPEWGGPEAGSLQDAVWLDFTGDWWIDEESGRLTIQVREEEPGRWWIVSAPLARVTSCQR